MQKIILIFFLTMYCACTVHSESQSVAPEAQKQRSMAIAGSPIAPMFGGVNIHFQTKLTDFLVLTLPVNCQYSWLGKVMGDSLGEEKGIRVTKVPIFFSAGLGTKFLFPSFGRFAFNGESNFFVEPRFLVAHSQMGLKHRRALYSAKTWRLSSLVMVGQDFVFDSGLFLNFGLGAGISYFFKNETNMPWETSKDPVVNMHFPPKKQKVGVALEGDLNIGFAW